MKYFYICFLLFVCSSVSAQEELKVGVFYYPISNYVPAPKTFYFPKNDFHDYTTGIKLISVRTANPYFKKTYLISNEGQTISSGFMPAVYFNQTHDLNMANSVYNAYLNPYNYNSASPFQSDAFNSFVNTFISQYKLSIKFSNK